MVTRLSRAALDTLIVAMVFFTIMASVVFNLYLTHLSINANDHRWCTTLELLTSHPVPKPANPQANPSREGQYRFYVTLLKLTKDFGCS